MPNVHDPLKVMVETVADDEDIRERVKELCFKALDEAEYLMDHGNHTVRLQIMRSLMPGLVKSVGKKTESDELQALRETVNALMVEMRQVSAPVPVVGGDELDDLALIPVKVKLEDALDRPRVVKIRGGD